jgi:hypothetical protein
VGACFPIGHELADLSIPCPFRRSRLGSDSSDERFGESLRERDDETSPRQRLPRLRSRSGVVFRGGCRTWPFM